MSCRVRLLNPLNAELNPIRYLLALAGAHRFVHVSRLRVKPCGEGEVVSLLSYENKDVSGYVFPSILHFDTRMK